MPLSTNAPAWIYNFTREFVNPCIMYIFDLCRLENSIAKALHRKLHLQQSSYHVMAEI